MKVSLAHFSPAGTVANKGWEIYSRNILKDCCVHQTVRSESLKYHVVNNMLVSFRPREEKITNYAFFWMFTERAVDWEVMETTVQLSIGECMAATKSLC